MGKEDAKLGGEKARQEREAQLKERFGRTDALASDQAAEEDALNVLREAAEGADEERKLKENSSPAPIESGEKKREDRERMKEIAVRHAQKMLNNADEWRSVADERHSQVRDLDALADGEGDGDILAIYQDEFPGISAADFAFMAKCYRQEIIRMLVDANGMSPQAYARVLHEQA